VARSLKGDDRVKPTIACRVSRPLDREAARSRSRHAAIISLVAALAALVGMLAVRQLPSRASGLTDVVLSPESYVYVALFAGALTFALMRTFAAEIERLRDLSITDPLTGLFNRRHFEERIEVEVARSRRHQEPLTVLLIDVDRLKQINDTGGHAAGDRALMRIARAISLSLRSSDVAARLGGDEFAVFLPNTTANDAAALAQRIQDRIGSGRPLADSVSIGIADLRIGVSGWRSLVFSADAALYDAKAKGGGQTVIASRRVSLELVVAELELDADDGRARVG
jgi:diguanylate cyclase (GGDEF)-like protein